MLIRGLCALIMNGEVIMKKANKGFTLAELLIVVAIIAVLVAISIPIFSGQLEKARQATDKANARSAYAAAVANWLTDPKSESTTYTYTGADAVEGNTAVHPYGKSSTDSSSWENMPFKISGVPKDSYVTVTIDKDGIATLRWGSGYGTLWAGISGKKIDTSSGGNWYSTDSSSIKNKKTAYDDIRKISNSKRREADLDVLNSLASYFNSLNTQQLKDILGENMYNRGLRGDGLLFKYQIDGGDSYSVRLNPDGATKSTDYFTELGYSAKVYSGEFGETENKYSFSNHNYVDTYLFTSDEVIEARANEHQIKFKITDEGTTFWITGTDLKTTVEK